MNAAEIKVYEIFKQRFNEKEAEAVIEYFETKAEEKINHKRDIFLTKDDKVEILEKLANTKAEIIKWLFIFIIGQTGIIVAVLKLFFG